EKSSISCARQVLLTFCPMRIQTNMRADESLRLRHGAVEPGQEPRARVSTALELGHLQQRRGTPDRWHLATAHHANQGDGAAQRAWREARPAHSAICIQE